MGMDLVALRHGTFREDLEEDFSEAKPDTTALKLDPEQEELADESKGPNGFHANWTWWGVLLSCLDVLGADLTLASGSNDGDEVPHETALAWAELLEPALPNLVFIEVKHEDSSFSRTSAHILPSDGFRLLEYGRVPDAEMCFLSDKPSLYAYLEEFVLFLRTCGGFAQY